MTEMTPREPVGATRATPAHDASADDTHNPFVFHLSAETPTVYDGGNLRGANEDTFPIVTGQKAAIYLVTLEVGGIREPHWHPRAWEANYIISGAATWSVLGTHPDGRYHNKQFDVGKGDLVFIPQGYFHYFANASDAEPLTVFIVFNSSTPEPNDDIGIVASFAALPNDVLETVFKVPAGTFNQIPKNFTPVVITTRS
jgi:oxalate decarboxylase